MKPVALSMVVAAWLAAGPGAAAPKLALPRMFGSGMVLQRERRVPVWGTATPGASIEVVIAGQRKRTRADRDGSWRVEFDPMPAGGPHSMRVIGPDTLVFDDVLVGDVWLASGQSNMEMPVDGWGKVIDSQVEVAAADFPRLRLLQVEHTVSHQPLGQCTTTGWRACTPESVREFSATGYFFGRMLHRQLGVPIGILQATWGGTVVESWTSARSLRRISELRPQLDAIALRAHEGTAQQARREYQEAMQAWLVTVPAADLGNSADPPWSSPELDDRDWPRMQLPCGWEDAGYPDLDGVMWFRKQVTLPPDWAGQELELHLGRIDDADTTWFDGVPVGHDDVYDRPRQYRIPAAMVSAGTHTIAVRVFDWIGGGGLWGEPWRMKLASSDRDSIPLAGEWAHRVGLDLRDTAPRPQDPDDPNQPTVLSNGMIQPLAPYALRGIIWYQGEANAPRAHQYRKLFPLLIEDWRQRWDRADLPFLFVQLANWQQPQPQPGDSDWAELREAQAMALSRPHTGMVVAIDIGDAADIHPRNKQEVGRRLALVALRDVYGRDVTASGPMWRSLRTERAQLRLRFDHTDSGLSGRGGGPPQGFAVAAADRVFHWAQARIEGDEVVVWSDQVTRPVAARYAWATNPTCDLVNGAGLPAAPFRTDRWPGVTEGRR